MIDAVVEYETMNDDETNGHGKKQKTKEMNLYHEYFFTMYQRLQENQNVAPMMTRQTVFS